MGTSSTDRVRAFRARERAKLEADPDARLRDADELLLPAVRETLAALGAVDGQDAAVAKLAERYAATIDRAKDPAYAMRWLGPLMLEVLTELNATPMSRSKLKTDPPRTAPSFLDQMRAARSQRPI